MSANLGQLLVQAFDTKEHVGAAAALEARLGTAAFSATTDFDAAGAAAAVDAFRYSVCTSAADTPQGVSFTSGNSIITGTLIASADTKFNIYLVPAVNGTKNSYNEYLTVENNNVYSWEKIGSTDVDISTKADKSDTVLNNTLSMGRKANTTIGTNSTALGYDVTASGNYSHAEGINTVSSGAEAHAEGSGGTFTYNGTTYDSGALAQASHTEGMNCRAEGGNGAHAEGDSSYANGQAAHAEGYKTYAVGGAHAEGGGGSFTLNNNNYVSGATTIFAHSEGNKTLASEAGAHSEGRETVASGKQAHSEGQNTVASGDNSHAEGMGGAAVGVYSHKEGYGTNANGQASHSEGYWSIAQGQYTHAEGYNTVANAQASHAEGYGNGNTSINYSVYNSYDRSQANNKRNVAGGTSSYSPGARSLYSHVEGYQTATGGAGSEHAEGYQTLVMGGGGGHVEGKYTFATGGGGEHAEGIGTFANGSGGEHAEGQYSGVNGGSAGHAEGLYTFASGMAPHTEGEGTFANSSGGPHAEGYYTQATGTAAHAEGYMTIASGHSSHAEGYHTISNEDYTHVSGSYNVEDHYNDWPEWTANTSYEVNDKVKITSVSNNVTTVYGYKCKTANADSSFNSSNWVPCQNFIEIIGNGTAENARSNGRALDWDGNEYLKGDLYINCNADSTGGTKLENASAMVGADGSNAGSAGLVPAPAATDNTKYLRGDGAWADVDALPAVTSSDNDKSLEVKNGEWAVGNKKIDKEYSADPNGLDGSLSAKTWTELTSFNGTSIWTDGENIYCSSGSSQYVLDKSTSTWSAKTWTGLTNFDGSYIWTDGENIYYSGGSSQYVLDKSTSTWSTKTWTGLTSFIGSYIWTDGENIYYSNYSQYVLDKSTSTWSAKTWIGLTSFYGQYIWTDGVNIYYSNSSNQYVLDKSTSTWSAKTWTGLTSFYGQYIWTDGENIYYSSSSDQYIFGRTYTYEDKLLFGRNGEYSGMSVSDFEVTQSASGLMSAADKTKLDGIATGATANVVSDSLSDTSTTNALSAAQGKALNDSLTTLNGKIAPKALNPTISGNMSLTSGGFYQIGNLVVCQARFNVTTAFSGNAITGLPTIKGAGGTTNTLPVMTNKDNGFVVDGNGNVKNDTITTGALLMSFSYVTD